ncbi:MAG: hypothetical protein LC808_27470 [Actinobacteria bacterium]|nr:hypothetical protein [Actinomycetota bacterium]
MSLFKRRVSTEELLRGHLERVGVSPFWLRSALDAIRYCERGEYFQPVFSVAGPAPARSVIALMRLEPFVRGEIDWTVSPSESPFWVGSVGDLHDELFDETARRFVNLYWSDQNPSAAPAYEAALRSMVAAVEESLSEASERELDEKTWRGVWGLGSAGYVWRVAESAAQTSDLNLRADLAREVEAVVDSLPPADASHERVLAQAASECVGRNLLFGSGSPGGWAAGGEFLRRGFRFAERHVVPEGVTIPRDEQWYAFSFGVALYDVDECLARRPAPPADRSQRRALLGVEASARR